MLNDLSAASGSAEYFRERAGAMLKLAEETASQEAKLNFLSLAKHWHRLAQSAEKSQLVIRSG